MGTFDIYLLNDPVAKAYEQDLRAEGYHIFRLGEIFQNHISGHQLYKKIWNILGEGIFQSSCFML